MLNRKKIVIFVLFLTDGMILFMPWNRVKVPDSARCRNPNLINWVSCHWNGDSGKAWTHKPEGKSEYGDRNYGF